MRDRQEILATPESDSPNPAANLKIVLVKTRFPENIGMAARACANMGFPNLVLVAPELWNKDKAKPLATSQGIMILDNIRIHETLREAVASCQHVYGTTARTGGWRRELFSPRQIATTIAAQLNAGEQTALVFGPEDKGLMNEEITFCDALIHIRTSQKAGSLNLAQSVLIALYECFQELSCEKSLHSPKSSRVIDHEELARLEGKLKKIIYKTDGMMGQNPDYFFMQWHGLLARAALRRHEYDALMGFCRQIQNKLEK